MWIGKPADYSHLHTFGSPVYVMYNAQEIMKLDSKSRKCIFLRYTNRVKGYCLWNPTAHKVVISRDVIFAEDKLQGKENDGTTKEKPNTTTVQIENRQEGEDADSFKTVPEHDVQEPVQPKAFEVRRSTRDRRPLT